MENMIIKRSCLIPVIIIDADRSDELKQVQSIDYHKLSSEYSNGPEGNAESVHATAKLELADSDFNHLGVSVPKGSIPNLARAPYKNENEGTWRNEIRRKTQTYANTKFPQSNIDKSPEINNVKSSLMKKKRSGELDYGTFKGRACSKRRIREPSTKSWHDAYGGYVMAGLQKRKVNRCIVTYDLTLDADEEGTTDNTDWRAQLESEANMEGKRCLCSSVKRTNNGRERLESENWFTVRDEGVAKNRISQNGRATSASISSSRSFEDSAKPTSTHGRTASRTTNPTPQEFNRILLDFRDNQTRLHEGYIEGISCLKAMITSLQHENQVMKPKIER